MPVDQQGRREVARGDASCAGLLRSRVRQGPVHRLHSHSPRTAPWQLGPRRSCGPRRISARSGKPGSAPSRWGGHAQVSSKGAGFSSRAGPNSQLTVGANPVVHPGGGAGRGTKNSNRAGRKRPAGNRLAQRPSADFTEPGARKASAIGPQPCRKRLLTPVGWLTDQLEARDGATLPVGCADHHHRGGFHCPHSDGSIVNHLDACDIPGHHLDQLARTNITYLLWMIMGVTALVQSVAGWSRSARHRRHVWPRPRLQPSGFTVFTVCVDTLFAFIPFAPGARRLSGALGGAC